MQRRSRINALKKTATPFCCALAYMLLVSCNKQAANHCESAMSLRGAVKEESTGLAADSILLDLESATQLGGSSTLDKSRPTGQDGQYELLFSPDCSKQYCLSFTSPRTGGYQFRAVELSGKAQTVHVTIN